MDFIMKNTVLPEAGATPASPSIVLGSERLLGIPEVCEITGFRRATAAKIIKETGLSMRLHSRLFITESSFFAYLHRLEVA